MMAHTFIGIVQCTHKKKKKKLCSEVAGVLNFYFDLKEENE